MIYVLLYLVLGLVVACAGTCNDLKIGTRYAPSDRMFLVYVIFWPVILLIILCV